MIDAPLLIASRGLISIVPRFPMTTILPAPRNHREILREVDVGEHFEDHIGTAPVGGFQRSRSRYFGS